MRAPFQAELLTVYLIRWLSLDLVDHLARCKGGSRAVGLDTRNARYLGIGNATGLGMAPFLIRYPLLINNWVLARETALARVRSLPAGPTHGRSRASSPSCNAPDPMSDEWTVADSTQMRRIRGLRDELRELQSWCVTGLEHPFPWDAISRYADRAFSIEGQEFVASLLLEQRGDIVDELATGMSADAPPALRPDMLVKDLLRVIDTHYGWALTTDFARPEASQRFWYYSEEKLEPRVGDRATDPGAELEMPIAVARDVSRLRDRLLDHGPHQTIADFLVAWPEFRHIARPHAMGREASLWRNPRQPAGRGSTARRYPALQARVLRRFQFRSEVGVVDTGQHVPGCTATAGNRRALGSRMGLSSTTPMPGTPGVVMSGMAQPLSLNEISFYFTRAAVGAGAPFGIGEEFSELSKYLAYLGFDPAVAVLPALRGLDLGESSPELALRNTHDGVRVESRTRRPLSAILAGPVVADRLAIGKDDHRERRILVCETDQPLLIAAAAAGVGPATKRILVSWNPPCGEPAAIEFIGDIARCSGLNSADFGPARVEVRFSGARETASTTEPTASRRLADGRRSAIERGIFMDNRALTEILAYFRRCLVPSSSRSRDSGAGSGMTDND